MRRIIFSSFARAFCRLQYLDMINGRTLSSLLSHDWIESRKPLFDMHPQRMKHSAPLPDCQHLDCNLPISEACTRKPTRTPPKCIHSRTVQADSITNSTLCVLKTSFVAKRQNLLGVLEQLQVQRHPTMDVNGDRDPRCKACLRKVNFNAPQPQYH